MLQCAVPRVGSKALSYCIPGYIPYPSVSSVLTHIFSCLFLWDPCFWFLWLLLVTYLIGQYLLVSWWGALDLPLSFTFPPRTEIRTLASFGNSPCSSCPWSWSIRQLLARFPWRCSGFLMLFFYCVVYVSAPPTGPLFPVPGMIVDVIWGRGWVVSLCFLAHFLKCCPCESLGGGTTFPFFSTQWELCTLRSVFLLFSSFSVGVPIGVLVTNFCLIGVTIGVLFSNFCEPFTFSLSYLIS